MLPGLLLPGLLLTGLLLPGLVLAQADDGQSIRIGETDLYPVLRIQYQQNDNAFLTPDNETEVDEILIQPQLLWRADKRTAIIEGFYIGDYLTSDEAAREYNDHRLGVNAGGELSSRQRVEGQFVFQRGHEAVGTELLRGVGENIDGEPIDEPILFNEFAAEAQYLYGALTARGNVGLGLRYEVFDYTNFDSLTEGRDYSLVEPFGEFSLRVSPDTRVLFGVAAGVFDYDNDLRDRTDYTAYTGLEFAATGQLSGEAQIGVEQAVFKEGDQDDQQTLTASAALTFDPVSYSSFRLLFDREFDNRTSNVATDDGGQTSVDVLTITDRLRLDWRFDWSSRVFHRANVQAERDDRQNSVDDSTTVGAGLELNFVVRRWLQLGLGFSSTQREGEEDPELDYDRQIVSAHLRATL